MRVDKTISHQSLLMICHFTIETINVDRHSTLTRVRILPIINII